MKQREGYVLLLVIMMIGMMTLLVTRLLVKLTVFERLNSVFIHREQAKLLAWSGIEMALAQLCAQVPEPKPGTEGFIKRTLFELRKVIMLCNKWQKVSLTDDVDGIDGTCAFYVACEGGKLNPNGLYDAEKKSLLESPVLTVINDALKKQLAKWGRDMDLLQRMAAVMSTRSEPLQDVSELLRDEQLRHLSAKLFMHPASTFALTDLFSVEREGITLQPWALSASLTNAFELQSTGTLTDAQWSTLSDAFTKEPAGSAVWDKLFKVLYGETHPTTIKQLYPFFNQRFEADLFSVISYGSYNDIVVALHAIIQRRRVVDENGVEQIHGFVKRVYWVYDNKQKE